jgi:hypothetical protein
MPGNDSFSRRNRGFESPHDYASRKRGMTGAAAIAESNLRATHIGGAVTPLNRGKRDRDRTRGREAKLGQAPPLAHLDNDSTPRRCRLCRECPAVGPAVGWTNPRAFCPRSASRRGCRAACALPGANAPDAGRPHSSVSQGSIGRARATSYAAARSKERHLLAPDRGVFAPVGEGGETGAARREPCPTTKTVSSGVARCSAGRPT